MAVRVVIAEENAAPWQCQHLRACYCICGPRRNVGQPQLQCCIQAPMLQDSCQQFTEHAITSHSNNAIQLLQLLQGQPLDETFCVALTRCLDNLALYSGCCEHWLGHLRPHGTSSASATVRVYKRKELSRPAGNTSGRQLQYWMAPEAVCDNQTHCAPLMEVV